MTDARDPARNPASITLRPLTPADLAEATDVLGRACAFDAAAAVAQEKLFAPAPGHAAAPVAAVRSGRIAGLVVTSGACVRLLAVAPEQRGSGVGSALLAHAERVIAAASPAARVTIMGQAGNYLAPGVDARDHETIAWLERRGYARRGEAVSLIVDVHGPRARAAAARAVTGYEIRRASLADADALERVVAGEFSPAWAFEVRRALDHDPPGVHLALRQGRIAAFAAHDGNNQGLGWFGPAGTLPAHRGQGLGEALLGACLVDVARAHASCEIAWIGPRAFYERACGVAGERRFALLQKDLP